MRREYRVHSADLAASYVSVQKDNDWRVGRARLKSAAICLKVTLDLVYASRDSGLKVFESDDLVGAWINGSSVCAANQRPIILALNQQQWLNARCKANGKDRESGSPAEPNQLLAVGQPDVARRIRHTDGYSAIRHTEKSWRVSCEEDLKTFRAGVSHHGRCELALKISVKKRLWLLDSRDRPSSRSEAA